MALPKRAYRNRIPRTNAEAERFLWHVREYLFAQFDYRNPCELGIKHVTRALVAVSNGKAFSKTKEQN